MTAVNFQELLRVAGGRRPARVNVHTCSGYQDCLRQHDDGAGNKCRRGVGHTPLEGHPWPAAAVFPRSARFRRSAARSSEGSKSAVPCGNSTVRR